MTYISSQSLTTPMRQSVLQIQSGMAQAQTEISSGRYADLGLTLGASTGTALSLKSEMDHLQSYTNSNALVTTRLSATSNALTTMVTDAQNISQDLTEATGVGATSTLQTSAQNALQSLTGALNTTAGAQYIFGGINTGTQPIATDAASNAQTTATANFQSYLTSIGATASTITGPQMQTFLDGTFSAQFSDTNWTSGSGQWSSASNATMQTNILPSESLNTSVSANDSSIRQVTQAYTMLGAFAGQNLSAAANSVVVASAGKLMSSGIAGLNNVVAGVGIAQNEVDSANTQINSQVLVLTSNVSSLTEVDPVALQTKVTQLDTQLQASYELTSKLAQLSLVNYLNG